MFAWHDADILLVTQLNGVGLAIRILWWARWDGSRQSRDLFLPGKTTCKRPLANARIGVVASRIQLKTVIMLLRVNRHLKRRKSIRMNQGTGEQD